MLDFTKFEYIAIDIFRNNHLSWVFDAKVHFSEIVKEGN